MITTLQVHKTAEPKLCKSIISHSNKELVNSISQFVLKVLNSNIKMTNCKTRKVQKHKAALSKVADGNVSLREEETHGTAGGFLLPLSSAVLPRSLTSIYETDKIMLRKMYLVAADSLHGDKSSPLKKGKHRPYVEQVKKRKRHPYEEQVKICKHHP